MLLGQRNVPCTRNVPCIRNEMAFASLPKAVSSCIVPVGMEFFVLIASLGRSTLGSLLVREKENFRVEKLAIAIKGLLLPLNE